VEKNPNPGLKFDGRMYPPREDFTTRAEDGSIKASTKGNHIYASPDGTLEITSRRTDDVVCRREGAGTTPAQQAGRSQEQTQQQSRGTQQGQSIANAANVRSTRAGQGPQPKPTTGHGNQAPPPRPPGPRPDQGPKRSQ
jgi:hypothetical protein